MQACGQAEHARRLTHASMWAGATRTPPDACREVGSGPGGQGRALLPSLPPLLLPFHKGQMAGDGCVEPSILSFACRAAAAPWESAFGSTSPLPPRHAAAAKNGVSDNPRGVGPRTGGRAGQAVTEETHPVAQHGHRLTRPVPAAGTSCTQLRASRSFGRRVDRVLCPGRRLGRATCTHHRIPSLPLAAKGDSWWRPRTCSSCSAPLADPRAGNSPAAGTQATVCPMLPVPSNAGEERCRDGRLSEERLTEATGLG
eukprot:365285-Chlamydomonas_euryale.AAC.5